MKKEYTQYIVNEKETYYEGAQIYNMLLKGAAFTVKRRSTTAAGKERCW